MTGAKSDPLEWQQHIRGKKKRRDLADRFKDPADPFSRVCLLYRSKSQPEHSVIRNTSRTRTGSG